MTYRDEYPRQAVGGLECLFHIGDGINDRQTVFKGTGGICCSKPSPAALTRWTIPLTRTLWPPGRRASAWDGKSDLIRCTVNGIEVNTNATVTLPTSYDFGLSIGTYEGSLFPHESMV